MESDEMIDIAFDFKGGLVPTEYAFDLWSELVRALPWLEAEREVGILPLKGAASREGLLLPQRAKLVLRLPTASAQRAMGLAGKTLDIGGYPLHVGGGTERKLESYPTLHAHIVESANDEIGFLEDVEKAMRELEISCKWICGKPQTLRGEDLTLSGYSLVVHDLKPRGSLHLQQTGLGNYRRFGCGIFIPHKTIAGLD